MRSLYLANVCAFQSQRYQGLETYRKKHSGFLEDLQDCLNRLKQVFKNPQPSVMSCFCSQIGTRPELVAHTVTPRTSLLWSLAEMGLQCQYSPGGDNLCSSVTVPHWRHTPGSQQTLTAHQEHKSNHLPTALSDNGPAVLGVFTQGKKHPAGAQSTQ